MSPHSTAALQTTFQLRVYVRCIRRRVPLATNASCRHRRRPNASHCNVGVEEGECRWVRMWYMQATSGGIRAADRRVLRLRARKAGDSVRTICNLPSRAGGCTAGELTASRPGAAPLIGSPYRGAKIACCRSYFCFLGVRARLSPLGGRPRLRCQNDAADHTWPANMRGNLVVSLTEINVGSGCARASAL